MNKKGNLRFLESEEKIIKAVLKLAKNNKIDKVSVSSICREANINPSTFYAHYQDIYDLIDRLSRQYSEEMLEEESKYNIEENESYIFTKESLCIFLNSIKKHKEYYFVILQTRKEFPLKEGFDYLWYIISQRCKAKGITDDDEIMYYFIGYQASFTMVLKRWVDFGCKDDEKKIAEIIYDCLPMVLK